VNVEPLEIEVKPGQAGLRIAWDDGQESLYPLRYLRGYCPCAHCQGHGGPVRFVAVDAPKITRIDEVGSYAINIVWQDEGAGTHATGIYSWDYLRDLDPTAGHFERRDLST
jgi:DUF971 family protein